MTQVDPTSPAVQLDKRVAALFACSRAQAQQYIEDGWVSVDGTVTETPQTMVSGERIELASDAHPTHDAIGIAARPGV